MNGADQAPRDLLASPRDLNPVQLTTRAAEIEHLKLQIAKLRHLQFGRKSEKIDHQVEQLDLQIEDLQAGDAEAERQMPGLIQCCARSARTWPNSSNSCRPASA